MSDTVVVIQDTTETVAVVAQGPQGIQGPVPWLAPVAWATGQIYVVGPPASCVSYGGGSYVCKTAHTSGGSFDATKWTMINDPGNAQAAQAAQTAAEAARDSAQGYSSSASSSASNASSSAASALSSKNAAATSETNAAASATSASNDKTSVSALLASFRGAYLGAFASDSAAVAFAAANSISIVDGVMYENTASDKFRIYNGSAWQDYDSSASASQSAAALSATNAATSETNALSYKNAAATSATNAATSETNAANSATAASNSASAAATSATNAATSASAASTSATNASNSASAASTSASSASTSATNAASSATAASGSASSASTSATNAATSASAASTSATNAAASAAIATAASGTAVGYTIDGGGAVITTGVAGPGLVVPCNCTINSVTLIADVSGSAVIDILKSTYAGFPPVSSICASAKPTLSSAQKSQDTTLTGWTTSVSAGDILYFNVNSCSTITAVTVALRVTRS